MKFFAPFVEGVRRFAAVAALAACTGNIGGAETRPFDDDLIGGMGGALTGAAGTGGAATGGVQGQAGKGGTGAAAAAGSDAQLAGSPGASGGSSGGGAAGTQTVADAGARDASATPDARAADAGSGPPPGWIPAVVGVGYAGIRIRSTDEGKSWAREARLAASGGDDQNLLRSVAYGNGRWAAGGWQYFTSEDGTNWTKQTHPCGSGIVEGMAFGNGRFVATCGDSSFWSTDGLKWSTGGRFRPNGHPKVVFAGGKFAAFGDGGEVFGSTDGATWTSWPGLRDATACDDVIMSRSACRVSNNGAKGRGVWLRGYTPNLGGEGIFRSTDGTTYTRASAISAEAFAFGWAPP